MALDNIQIVTDSTCDLQSHLQDESISIVPLKVFFGDKEYADHIDIKPKDFYARIKTSDILPRTSQPSPGEILCAYNKLKEQGINRIISIHLSSKLSGTVQSAIAASGMIKGMDIRIIDSGSASLGLGLLCLAADQYLKEMSDLNQVVERIEQDKLQICVYFTLGSLDYLEKGGRIGRAKAFLGKLFDFKPILSVRDGEIQPVEKLRGDFPDAIARIAKLIQERIKAKNNLRFLGVVHSCLEDEVASLVKLLQKDLKVEIMVSELGCVLGSHVGPEAIGIVAL